GTRTGGPSSGERPLPGTVRSHVARLPFSSRRDVRRRRTGRGRSSLQAAAATRAPAGGDGVTLASRCRVSDVGEGGRTMFLLVGATGTLGGSIAKKLLQAGERVRVLVRGSSPARAHGPHTDPEELRQAGAEVVSGDLRDPESLRRAAQGVRVVVSTASGTKRAPPDTTGAVDGEGTANLAAAATEAGVARFVLVSAAGAGEGAPAGLLQDKWRGEEALRASGPRASWAIESGSCSAPGSPAAAAWSSSSATPRSPARSSTSPTSPRWRRASPATPAPVRRRSTPSRRSAPPTPSSSSASRGSSAPRSRCGACRSGPR